VRRVPWLLGTAGVRPSPVESQPAEPGPDRNQIVVFGPAAGACCEVAADLGARAGVEGADDIGTDVTAPLGA
jgi:hypothetical protein